MTQTLAVDATNDLFRGADGNLSRAYGLDAVTQAAQQAARTLLGEMIYAADQGVPYFEAAWSGAPNLRQFEAYLRRAFLAVADVLDVPTLTIMRPGNSLSYSAVIRTTYGLATLHG